MSTTKKKTTKAAPTAEEIGRWYEEHSATEDEPEPVAIKAVRKYDPTFTMRLPQDALQRLKELADDQGVPTTTMARMLLLEALERATDPARTAAEVLAAVVDNPRLREALRALVGEAGDRGVERARSILRQAASSPATCSQRVGPVPRLLPAPGSIQQFHPVVVQGGKE